MAVTAREAAFKALSAYRKDGTWPVIELNRLILGAHMSKRDMALATRLLNGVLQNMTLCDFYIGHFSSHSLKRVDIQTLDILRLSVYQVMFMSKIPPSAAVNEGVALAKKYAGARTGGFVNAVLRKLVAAVEEDALPEVDGSSPRERLSILYSHPEWIVGKFIELLGRDGAEDMLRADNGEVPVTAQVNSLKAGSDETLQLLKSDEVDAERHEWLDACLNLRAPGSIERLTAYQNGYIYIQDAAARLAVMAGDPKPGDFVIDVCAAPGGKSFAAAIAMKDAGTITACDIAEGKLAGIRTGAEKLGISIIETRAADMTAVIPELSGKADLVLADVPCSGLGVIRKKPEIRYKAEKDIAGLPEKQKKILLASANYVKPGGTLIYSTCTVLKSENEEVVEAFLKERDDFAPEGFTLPGPAGNVSGGMITLWPHIHGTDGFFICRLRKKDGETPS